MNNSTRVLLAALALAAAATVMLWREGQARPLVVLTPTLTGKPELCLTCHAGIEEISASHPSDAFGCVICHGGDPLALDEQRAHATLRGGRNPSDLRVAAQNCGQNGCHGGYADEEQNHVARVLNSVQATYAGALASVRYAFGAQASPRAEVGVLAASDASPALPGSALRALAAFVPGSGSETAFQQHCLMGGCHLSAPAVNQPYYYRSTGCAACHYLYAADGLYRGGDQAVSHTDPGHGVQHRLTTSIPYSQCDHCHNRGNYSLKQMSFIPRDDLPPAAAPIPATMQPEGRRQREYYQPQTIFTRCEIELDCIDCHTAQEAMGDGHIYGAKKDAQYVQCQTCHGTRTSTPPVAAIQDANQTAMRQARISGHADYLKVGDRVIVTGRGELLWAVKQTATGGFVQIDKVTGKPYAVPQVAGSQCTQDGSSQSSDYCHECHKAEQ